MANKDMQLFLGLLLATLPFLLECMEIKSHEEESEKVKRSTPYGQPQISTPYGQPQRSTPYGQPQRSTPYGQRRRYNIEVALPYYPGPSGSYGDFSLDSCPRRDEVEVLKTSHITSTAGDNFDNSLGGYGSYLNTLTVNSHFSTTEEQVCRKILQSGDVCPLDRIILENSTDIGSGFCGPRRCSPGLIFVFDDLQCHHPRSPGLCPPGRELRVTSFGTPICQCPGITYETEISDTKDVCEPLLTPSNKCPPNQVLWFTDFRLPLTCVDDPCGGINLARNKNDPPYAPFPSNGRCYQVGQVPDVCPPNTEYGLHMPSLSGRCLTKEDLGYETFTQEGLQFLVELFGNFLSEQTEINGIFESSSTFGNVFNNDITGSSSLTSGNVFTDGNIGSSFSTSGNVFTDGNTGSSFSTSGNVFTDSNTRSSFSKSGNIFTNGNTGSSFSTSGNVYTNSVSNQSSVLQATLPTQHNQGSLIYEDEDFSVVAAQLISRYLHLAHDHQLHDIKNDHPEDLGDFLDAVRKLVNRSPHIGKRHLHHLQKRSSSGSFNTAGAGCQAGNAQTGCQPTRSLGS